MFMRAAAAATTTGMIVASFAFLTGIGVGAAAIGGACLARQAMKRRNSWKDDTASMSVTEAMPDEGEPMAGANPI
ncbi:MAG: hypothetical protein AVDCRST_MAG27-2190 [uncultured Craurococcus sp.]|uniref:Uncharacterized protein n=1 Tax=uncultured Craurococcus sp. TaxID=1135998 RepID=A0A6J4HXV4_9PROT|nr:MAG: hypothetical protein AVDCRST_MAG27-2190 [uncultured Craurococcus sp.]